MIHAFLINKPLKHTCNSRGVCPQYLDDELFHQEVFGPQYNTDEFEASKDGFKELGELLMSDLLDFCKETVYQKLTSIIVSKISSGDDSLPLTEDNAVKELLRCIPVYFVSSKFKDDGITETNEYGIQPKHIIPNDVMCTYHISWEELRELLEQECLEDIDICEMDELLGLYQRDDRSDRFEFLDTNKITSLDKVKCSCRIFLWIDNIKKHAANNQCSYKSLFFLVLCHEYMHALMDVYKETNLGNKLYETFKEESLANGFALWFFKEAVAKGIFTQSDFDCICGFVRNQRTQYQLGLLFQDYDILRDDVPEWINIKLGKVKLNQTDIKKWFNEIVNLVRQH